MDVIKCEVTSSIKESEKGSSICEVDPHHNDLVASA